MSSRVYRLANGNIKIVAYSSTISRMFVKSFTTYEAYRVWKNKICYGEEAI